MASKLCCTAEQEGRPDSPELPSARLVGATPAKQPLLPKKSGSPNSRFTSVRSDEFHELHQIFDHAQDGTEGQALPARAPRARFSRTSMYSLHSLYKMTSMRSLIKRKFSRDLLQKKSCLEIHIEATQKVTTADQDTVVRTSKAEAKQQLKITKDDLRKDLLSDKKPDEGGYDSDAEILDDIARDFGRKTPSKRASIHSVNWSPSSDSKVTPESSTKSRTNADCSRDLQPYQIQKPLVVSLTTRVGHVFSTPNLRVDLSDERNHALRRSQSTTSMGLPQVSPLSPLLPLRLPSLTSHDQNGVPWAEAINESLRLSQFPVPPRQVSPQRSQTLLSLDQVVKPPQHTSRRSVSDSVVSTQVTSSKAPAVTTRPAETRIPQSNSATSPHPSTSIQGILQENAQPSKEDIADEDEGEEEDNPRHSVHLYSMRISHHLRSGSLLSWEQITDAPELPSPAQPFCERIVPDRSCSSELNKQLGRHERQTSSSGFASSKMPSKWGKVLPRDHDLQADVASSIYSSRPQSPRDSFIASLTSLRRSSTGHDNSSGTSVQSPQTMRSNSVPTDNDTPRAVTQYGHSDLRAAQEVPVTSPLLATPVPLARKNSVADTKKSKFREEISPSPPRKRITPSESIMKFLNPKRLSARSQSEISLKAESPIRTVDGTFDTLEVANDRERRHSQSMISLRTEQNAMGMHKGADHVWNQALKAHQEEKASLFLPKNRDLAAHASPFRERSGSIMTRHSANETSAPVTPEAPNASTSLFAPSFSPSFAPQTADFDHHPHPRLISRRSAMAGASEEIGDRELSIAFEKQGDSPDIVGAWGSYPSHTRNERTNSAGKADRVESRDFALEAAIKFASAQDVDDDLVDPAERVPSMPLMPGEKKRKKKVGSGRMAKSSSMTFGKAFLKNYSKTFRSSSIEFRKHGRNHRSSIAAGGVLEFPELELLPEILTQDSSFNNSSDRSHRNLDSVARRRASGSNEIEKSHTHDSMATLRPRRNSSAPNLNESASHDGTDEDRHSKDNARVWSVYYDDCVPSYPRASVETDSGIEVFGGAARCSFEYRIPSMHSYTMPSRLVRHSRDASRVSSISVVSRGSAGLSFKSKVEDDELAEKRSMVSVRRSTMDLISKFKEQEISEREKVLSFTRAGSRHENKALAAL